MNPSDAAPPPDRVPTLTEVIEDDRWSSAPLPLDDDADAPAALAAPAPLPSEAQIVRGVMVLLQGQIDVVLEYRVREVLGPLLARAADSVVRDARAELASTLRDVVARAVEDEIARHRGR